MSTYILSACWKLIGMSSTQKLVLISLADQANDDGVCWPSLKTMSSRTCLSERAIRDAMAKLVESKVLKIEHRFNSSNVYTIDTANYAPPAPTAAPPAPTAAPPAPTAAPPLRQMPTNRNYEPSYNPHITVNEPSLSADAQKTKKLGLKDLLALNIDKQYAQDWLEVRKVKRAALTQTAINLLIKEALIAKISVNDAVRICAENSWQGFKAEWYFKLNNQPNQPKQSKHSGFAQRDYSVGISEDGSF